MKAVLKVGETTPVEIVLAPQGASAHVNVTPDSAETLDTETQSTGSLISPRLVSDLPIRGRNFTEFVQLTPAVVQESDRNGLAIAGQRSINSNVAVTALISTTRCKATSAAETSRSFSFRKQQCVSFKWSARARTPK